MKKRSKPRKVHIIIESKIIKVDTVLASSRSISFLKSVRRQYERLTEIMHTNGILRVNKTKPKTLNQIRKANPLKVTTKIVE